MMFTKQSLMAIAAACASCAVAIPAPPPTTTATATAAPANAYVTIQNQYNLCLKQVNVEETGGNIIEWDHCDQDGVIVFRKPADIGPLVSKDGKNCLTVYASQPKGFPDFKMAPCSAKADLNQSFVLQWGDDKNQIRAQTEMGVCSNGNNPEGTGGSYVFVSLPVCARMCVLR